LYKVDVESIDEKINSIKELRRNNVITIFLVISGLLFFVGLFSDIDHEALLIEGMMFSASLVIYVFVFPLLGKIELLEKDIENLKVASNVEDVKHY
jgi:hypothetical protein